MSREAVPSYPLTNRSTGRWASSRPEASVVDRLGGWVSAMAGARELSRSTATSRPEN